MSFINNMIFAGSLTGFAALSSCSSVGPLSPPLVLFQGDAPAAHHVKNREEALAKFPSLSAEEIVEIQLTEDRFAFTENNFTYQYPGISLPELLQQAGSAKVVLVKLWDEGYAAVDCKLFNQLKQRNKEKDKAYLIVPDLSDKTIFFTGVPWAGTDHRNIAYSFEYFCGITQREALFANGHEGGHWHLRITRNATTFTSDRESENLSDSIGGRPDPINIPSRDYPAGMSGFLQNIRNKNPQDSLDEHGAYINRIIKIASWFAADSTLTLEQRTAQFQEMKQVNQVLQEMQQSGRYRDYFPEESVDLLDTYHKAFARFHPNPARSRGR